MATARKTTPRPSIANAPAPAGRSLAEAFAPVAPTATAPAQPAVKAAPAKAVKKAAAKKSAAKAAKSSAPAKAAPVKTAPVKTSPAKSAVSKAATQAATPAKAGAEKATREAKARKPKLVRDSFTIPKTEYAVIDDLKARSARLGQPAKKSEVLRAGIKLLSGLTDAALLAALGQVPALKTGRPGKA